MLKDRFMIHEGVILDTIANTEVPTMELKDKCELLNEVNRRRVFMASVSRAANIVFGDKDFPGLTQNTTEETESNG